MPKNSSIQTSANMQTVEYVPERMSQDSYAKFVERLEKQASADPSSMSNIAKAVINLRDLVGINGHTHFSTKKTNFDNGRTVVYNADTVASQVFPGVSYYILTPSERDTVTKAVASALKTKEEYVQVGYDNQMAVMVPVTDTVSTESVTHSSTSGFGYAFLLTPALAYVGIKKFVMQRALHTGDFLPCIFACAMPLLTASSADESTLLSQYAISAVLSIVSTTYAAKNLNPAYLGGKVRFMYPVLLGIAALVAFFLPINIGFIALCVIAVIPALVAKMSKNAE